MDVDRVFALRSGVLVATISLLFFSVVIRAIEADARDYPIPSIPSPPTSEADCRQWQDAIRAAFESARLDVMACHRACDQRYGFSEAAVRCSQANCAPIQRQVDQLSSIMFSGQDTRCYAVIRDRERQESAQRAFQEQQQRDAQRDRDMRAQAMDRETVETRRAQQQAAEAKRRADDDSRRQKDELIAQGVHGLVELFFGDNKAKSDESSSKSEKDYSKYHDNSQKAKDKYDKAVKTDSVIKKIQDKSLELLKEKNLETVRRMDEITASVNQISNPFDSTASSSPEWKRTTPLPPVALNLPSENPWGSSNNNDRSSAAKHSDSTIQLDSRQTRDNIPGGVRGTGGMRGPGNEIIGDPRDNPWAESSAPTKQPSTSRPLANAATSTGNSSRYVDPKSGTEFVIPEGYVLYRDPATKQIRVVSRADLPANVGGDDTVKGKCSANGLLVITPKCEKARKRGS